MSNMEKKLSKNIQLLDMMYFFLFLIECVDMLYSIFIGVSFYYKLILLLSYVILGLTFKFYFKDNPKYINTFSYITLFVLLLFFLFFIFNGVRVFFVGFFLIEVAVVIIFSNISFFLKIFINTLFQIAVLFAFLFFDLSSFIVSQNLLFILGVSTFSLIAIIFTDKIMSLFDRLYTQSHEKSKQISQSNLFLKTILEQEKIKIIYYFPEDDKAELVSDNFISTKEKEITNFISYLRDKKIVPIEYFGIIQNSMKIILSEGNCSIILPLNLANSRVWMKLNGTRIIDEETKKEKIIISITNINDLKTVELKFKNALNKSSIAIWEYDIENDKITSYSDLILDYYFYGKVIENASTTLINRNIIYSNDIDIFRKALEKVQTGESDVTFEIRIFPSRQSTYTWVRINFTCFKDYLDNPKNAWVSIENIDDAKASEKWFEIERKKNFDNKTGLTVMTEINVSRDFVISYNSQYIDKILPPHNTSVTALLDSFINIGIVVEGKELLYQRLSQKFLLENYEKGRRVLEYEYKIITKDNDIIYLSNIIKLFLDLKTKEIIAFSFFYDITENLVTKLSIDSILKSKFVYLAYVNILNAHMTISKTQLEDVTNKSNPNRIYKYEWEVFINKYVHPEDAEYVTHQVSIENVKQQIKYKKTFNFDYRICDHGNMITMRRCHFVKTDENSPFIIILEENISNEMISRIKHELVLKEALVQATQAATAKSEFLSRMSHEIRTPLSAIIGLSELGSSSSIDDYPDYFNKINDSGQYLLGLMDDILDMNKLELGQIKLNPECVDTQDFYETILTIIKNQALKKNIDFTFNQVGEYYRYQYLEKLRVQQILLNVLNNAIKYTHSDGKVIYTIKNIEENNNLFAIHTIKDNGVGISKEFMVNIFKPFTREKNSLSDTEGGTGLGLAICSNLITQLKGTIKVDSKLNEGTTVTITLPITVSSKDEYLEKISTFDNSKDSELLIGKKILIAEDHMINAMIIKTILKNIGIEIVHVVDGIQAIDIFSKSKEGEFDLILMDIMMPKLNGLEATETIRNLNREDAKTIPIIALSANAFDEDRQRSLDYGMNDHLKKPIDTRILIKTLNKYI